MQWDVLCINQANATTSQDNSTISFDRETPGYKHRRKGGRQGGRRLAGRWGRYRQNERIISSWGSGLVRLRRCDGTFIYYFLQLEPGIPGCDVTKA